ncbi:MAG: hypothetical protein QMD61_00170 [Methanobacterium sp.]|nr:hypothetical protein [Methanobacterium sp.]
MKRLLTLFIVIPLVALLFSNFTVAVNLNQTYTFDEDFDNGTMTGLEHETTHNQLQISNPPATIPFIWVPNSNEGTVSKVDTKTGKELGRYRVSPFSYSSPSRTTVDLQGNCWVANRQTGTVVKIGLYENGGYIDRNLNGIIETSMDLNDDGIIDGDELLPWGLDECVLYDIILIPGKEGTYIPGQYTEGYANDSSNPGPRGVAVDAQNNIWVGTYATMKFYYINGSNGQIIKVIDVSSVNHKSYGAIIDENGVIWSSGHDGNNVLRLNPEDNSFFKINIPHFVYGLGIDRQNHLFVSGWTDSKLTRINTLTGAIEWTISCPIQSRGITVTDDGDVWVANSQAGTVSRYSNDGILKATINVGNNPTGLSMDADGKVWVVNYGDEYIHRINPATNSIELSKRIPGGLHYGYSDMTGAVSRTITTKLGTWTVIHDSEVNNVPWGTVSWNSFVPTGTDLNVKVRSSNDKINWSIWEEVQNGIELKSTAPGRYLQIWTTFQILSGKNSPILYDLKVKANVADLSITATTSNTFPSIGDSIKITLTVKNNGPYDANGVKTTFQMPSGLKYLSSSSNSYNLLTGQWNIGKLTSGSTISLEITGKLENAGLINNIATVSGNQIDQNMTNNNANVFLNVYPRLWIPGNSNNHGNENPNSGYDVNYHGISGQTNHGSSYSPIFDFYIKSLSGTLNQYSGDNILYEIDQFILDSIALSLEPNSFLKGNSGFNPFGKTPSQILNHYFGKYMPSELKDNSFFLDMIGWVYGSNSLLQHLTRFNPFSFNNYAGNKASEAALKAWKTGDIWDFFDYPFYHFYGYENLNNMWGGENIKWFLDNFFGIDNNGNMSVGYFLLNLATIIPIGRVASIGGKLLVRFLPKAAYLMKSPAVQFLLKNSAVQTILKGAKNYLVDPLAKLGQSVLLKLPKYLRNIKLKDITEVIKKISDIINLTPKTWIETIVKGLSKSSWISRNGSKLVTTVFDKLKLWRKVLPEEIPTIIADGIKLIWQGAKGGFSSLLNIFSDMTPLAVKEWVHTTPWRMRIFRGLKKLTSTHLYKDVHGVVSPLIKKNAALHSVYKAAKKVNEEIKKIPETAKIVVKTAANVIKTVAKTAKTVAKKVISKVTKTVKKVASKVSKVVKKVTKVIKNVSTKIVTKAKKIVKKVSKTVNKAINTVKNTISSGVNWMKSKIGW